MHLCTVEGCGRKHHAKGYCHTHYSLFRATGSPVSLKTEHICLKCGKKAVALSLCRYHYQRFWVSRIQERHTFPTRPWMLPYGSRSGVVHMQSWVRIEGGPRVLVSGCSLRMKLNPNKRIENPKPCGKCRHVLKEHGLL